jgi:hypothetical protein
MNASPAADRVLIQKVFAFGSTQAGNGPFSKRLFWPTYPDSGAMWCQLSVHYRVNADSDDSYDADL